MSDVVARTWGLDLSTNPRNVGLVCIEWLTSGQGNVILQRITSRSITESMDEIRTRIETTTALGEHWAVDVPFGWPRELGKWLVQHGGPCAAPLPAHVITSGSPWAGLASRVTDLLARKRADLPGGISVSFDKLGATAACWSMVELQLDRAATFDRSGLTPRPGGGRVVETWPAAAWRCWFPDDRLNHESWSQLDDRLGPVLATPLNRRLLRDDALGEWVSKDDKVSTAAGHYRDALVCALVARAASLGLTSGPAHDDGAVARSEGWIHLPAAERDSTLPLPEGSDIPTLDALLG